MNPYGIDFDETQTLPTISRPSYYHKNYNPIDVNARGSAIPHWSCLNCKVGLQVIEFCLQCPMCGLIVIKNLYHGWNGPNYPPQSSKYKYELHYKTLMECILARENITPKIEKIINDVNKWEVFSIEDVRWVLKNMGHTNYYKHAPLILKRVSGIGPPDIPNDKLDECRSIFSDVMRAYKQCFSRPNCAGYPFIIYKIFDSILPVDQPNGSAVDAQGQLTGLKGRCPLEGQEHRRILQYIQLPHAKTLAKRNEEWGVICDYINLPILCTI